VLQVVAELGYVPNESARALRAGRSKTLGLVVLDVANPFFTDIAAGVEEVADQHDMTITLCNSSETSARERRHLEHLQQLRVQGVLITPVDSSSAMLTRLAEQGIPVVFVDRASRARGRCSVGVDDVLGGQLVGEHLLVQGHRHVGFLGGPPSLRQVSDRMKGLRSVLDDARVKVTLVPTAALSIEEGQRAVSDLLRKRAKPPTALFCANDLLALGALQVLTREGVRVPDDMALVGYDDIIYAAAAAVPLTSVRQPRADLGRTAASLLMDEINAPEEHKHQHIQFAPELVVRASSS
jgi:LacI family transcriptional regulator